MASILMRKYVLLFSLDGSTVQSLSILMMPPLIFLSIVIPSNGKSSIYWYSNHIIPKTIFFIHTASVFRLTVTLYPSVEVTEYTATINYAYEDDSDKVTFSIKAEGTRQLTKIIQNYLFATIHLERKSAFKITAFFHLITNRYTLWGHKYSDVKQRSTNCIIGVAHCPSSDLL